MLRIFRLSRGGAQLRSRIINTILLITQLDKLDNYNFQLNA